MIQPLYCFHSNSISRNYIIFSQIFQVFPFCFHEMSSPSIASEENLCSCCITTSLLCSQVRMDSQDLSSMRASLPPRLFSFLKQQILEAVNFLQKHFTSNHCVRQRFFDQFSFQLNWTQFQFLQRSVSSKSLQDLYSIYLKAY